MGFPGHTSGKEPTCQCRRCKRFGFIPRWGRSLGGGHGSPLQYSCLENPMDRGAWWATVHGVTNVLCMLFVVLVAKSSPTLCDPMNCSPSGSSVHGISQARTLQWVAISFSAAAATKSLQLCPTLCNPIDSSPPASPVPGILQARTLEWVAISFSNG